MARDLKRCAFRGCDGYTNSQHLHCTLLCKLLDIELCKAERVVTVLGSDLELVAQLDAAVQRLRESWSLFGNADRRVYKQARETGFTDESWDALKKS